jgi:transposase InsO family protein
MGISRQAYYKRVACERHRQEKHASVVALVRDERRNHPRLGTRKLHHMLHEPLQRQGIKIGRDAMFDVLRDASMLVKPLRAFHKTTNSRHFFRRHPNLLKDGPAKVVPTACEQVWVADVTYLRTRQKMAYVSLVTDAYSRKIMGWHVHDGLGTEEVSQAFRMALRQRRTSQPLVHHSDRGIQYCSVEYQAIHARHGIACSMTDGYDCYQNAMAERINGILKTEYLLHTPADLQQASRMVKESVRLYNQERPHLSLEYETPDAIHRASLTAQRQPATRPEQVST